MGKQITVAELQELLPYCVTKKQTAFLDQLILHGGNLASYSNTVRTTERVLRGMLARIRKTAASRGHAPEYDMTAPVPEGFKARGVSTLYDAKGKVSAQWVKSERDRGAEAEDTLSQVVETLLSAVEGKSRKARVAPVIDQSEGLTAYLLGDPHFGMMAWDQETGSGDFDTDSCEADHTTALEYLISQAPKTQVGMLCNLGDAFHVDGINAVTPGSGHLLDSDGRLGYTIDSITRTFVNAVDLMLDHHGEVWVVNVRGNHDPSLSLAFNRIIEAYYRNDDRVTVLANDNKLINIEWGQTMLSFHHTDRLKFERWMEMLTRDHAPMWGRTRHRYGHGGHVHHKQVKEVGGMFFHTWPTLAAPDGWHAASGYGAGRSASFVTYDKEFGETQSLTCQLDRIRFIQANDKKPLNLSPGAE